MKISISLSLWALLTTLAGTVCGEEVLTAAPREHNRLVARASKTSSTAAANTSGAAVCKRNIGQEAHHVPRDPSKLHRLGKRAETIEDGRSPLVSALRNFNLLAGFAGIASSATGIITNRLSHGAKQHSLVTGLKGVAAYTGKAVIDGVTMPNPMPWAIRWDFDPDKGTHINAYFGKGDNIAKFAYVFDPEYVKGSVMYGTEYMLNAVKNLIGLAEYNSLESGRTGIPTFNGDQTDPNAEKVAIAAIAQAWQYLLDYGCGPDGAPIPNPNTPNQPPS